jgi:hypothetical protein
MKNSNNNIENGTRDLPACSAMPQPTAPQREMCNVRDAGQGNDHCRGRKPLYSVNESMIRFTMKNKDK